MEARKVRLYPQVKVPGQSFEGVSRVVVPNQSMSLQEIIKRFVRRESLPVAKDGYYEERFGDIEKLAHADMVIQMERVEELKSQIAVHEKRIKERQELIVKQQKEAAEASSKEPNPKEGNTDQKPTPTGA